MFSDVASIGLGAIIMVIIAALLAKREASEWLRGNSWGGQPVPVVETHPRQHYQPAPVVVETHPRQHYQPAWSIGEICDRNMQAGYLVYGAW